LTSSDNVRTRLRAKLIAGGPISRLRLLAVDLAVLVLQLTMLAITASTGPSNTTSGESRAATSSELDRTERGAGEDGGGDDEQVSLTSHDSPFEHVHVRVGVIDTIRSLWDSETPIVRRFR